MVECHLISETCFEDVGIKVEEFNNNNHPPVKKLHVFNYLIPLELSFWKLWSGSVREDVVLLKNVVDEENIIRRKTYVKVIRQTALQ